MSHAQTSAIERRPVRSRKRIDRVLLVAGVLLAALMIAELAVVLQAAPALDALAPIYVT